MIVVETLVKRILVTSISGVCITWCFFLACRPIVWDWKFRCHVVSSAENDILIEVHNTAMNFWFLNFVKVQDYSCLTFALCRLISNDNEEEGAGCETRWAGGGAECVYIYRESGGYLNLIRGEIICLYVLSCKVCKIEQRALQLILSCLVYCNINLK